MELAFTKKGSSKKILVLLHGYLSNKESFTRQIEFFSKYYTVIAPDLSGFGQNPKLERAYSLDDYISDLLSCLNSQGVKKCDIIAHSFGARLVLKSADLQKICDKLVITGGAGLKPKRRIGYCLKVFRYKFLKRFFPKSKRLNKMGSADYKSLSPVMKESFKKIVNEHLDGYLSGIEKPTLIIFGDKDRETPPYMARRFYKKIKNSQLYFIKGAGHFAFCTHSGVFNNVVREFLFS